MFKSRLKETKSVFNLVLLVKEPTENSTAECILNFPDLPEANYISKLSPFLFPCPHRNAFSEDYTVILTDGEGNLEFLVCRYLADAKLTIAISSYLPCLDVLHHYVLQISQEGLHHDKNHTKLIAFLQEIRETYLPTGKYSTSITLPSNITGSKRDFILPIDSKPTFYMMDMLEFMSALDKSIWIQVFGFVLLEYRILFHATHLKRLTACILSLLHLMYPLNWDHLIYPVLPESMIDFTGCPSPYIAGIPTCLLERAQSNLIPGTIIVDLNENYYSTVGLDFTESLPKCLKNFMLKKWKQYERSLTKNDLPPDNVKKFNRIFYQTMVATVGGYRSAFVQGASGSIEFNKEIFFQSRGADMESFLSQINESQMFRTFIQDRLDSLDDRKTDSFEQDIRNFNPKELQSQRISNAVNNLKKNIKLQGSEKLHHITNKVRDMQRRKMTPGPLKPESIVRWDSDPVLGQSLHSGHSKHANSMNRFNPDDSDDRHGYLTDEDLSGSHTDHHMYRISTTLITDEELNAIMKTTEVRPPSTSSLSSDEVSLSQENILDAIFPEDALFSTKPSAPPPRPSIPPPTMPKKFGSRVGSKTSADYVVNERSQSSSGEKPSRKNTYPPPDRTIPVITASKNKDSPAKSSQINLPNSSKNYTSPSIQLSSPIPAACSKPTPPPRPPPLQNPVTRNKPENQSSNANLIGDMQISSSNSLFADFDPLLESATLNECSKSSPHQSTDPDLLLSMDAIITRPANSQLPNLGIHSSTNPFLDNFNPNSVDVGGGDLFVNRSPNSLSRLSPGVSPNLISRVPHGRSQFPTPFSSTTNNSSTESAYFSPAESFCGISQRGNLASHQSGYSSGANSFYQTPRQSFTSISGAGAGLIGQNNSPRQGRANTNLDAADLQDPFQDILNQSLNNR